MLPSAASAADPAAASPPSWSRELSAIQARARPGAPPATLAAACRQLAARYPNEPAALVACGDFLSETAGEPDAALPLWQRAQTLAPADADVAERLANAHLRRGDWRPAVEQFRRGLVNRPDEARFHFALGNVFTLFRRDLTDAAHPTAEDVLNAGQEEFRQAARLAPASVEYAQAYAETFYLAPRPDWEAALDAWRAVLALTAEVNPDFARSHLVRVSLRQGRPAAARAFAAEIRSPEFAALKEKLLKRAAALEQSGGATGGAADGPQPR